MKKIMVAMILLCSSSVAYAGWSPSCSGRGDSRNCSARYVDINRVTGEKTPITIRYSVYRDKVDTASVCDNYRYGTKKRKLCGRAADRMFQSICENNRKKNRLYCTASRNFTPIN